MPKLSKTSKLDGILSWSLQAIETCSGSVGDDGALVDACATCYATQGMYVMGPVKAPRAFNKEDWKNEEWVAEMVAAITKGRKPKLYFRWFDSGDMYSVSLAWKMYEVMVLTPEIQHWLPTRMAKFEKFHEVLEAMQNLTNVRVRFSSDSIEGDYTPGLHGSTIIQEGQSTDAFVCGAPDNGGMCSGCRACYSKDIPVIAYRAHGNKNKRVIMMKRAAL
jgi:hypothetical protein